MRPLAPLLTVVVVALSCIGGAKAQSYSDFSTQRFRPTVGPGNYLGLDGATVQAAGAITYGLAFDYAAEALVVEHPCRALENLARCRDRRVALLERTGLAHLLLSAGIGTRTQLSFGLPLGASDTRPFSFWVTQPGASSMYRELRPKNGFVLGDLRAAAKVRVHGTNDDSLRVALVAAATLPTARLTSGDPCMGGERCTYIGERTTQAGGHAILELAAHPQLRAALLVGALYRPRERVLGAEVGSELSYGAALSYAVLSKLELKAELQGAVELRGADDIPLEARAGLSYGRDLVLTLGAGAGVLRDVGSPLYRLIAAVQWTPTFRDGDGDGLEDDDDACPREAEAADGFRDGDGCVDADNDGDGLLDAQDACDDAVEDRDGFADHDGCPDPDNDEDGVLDGYDSCEGAKEDRDGDHDDDGCPDLDTDRDGVLDANDRCVNEAEDTDGLADEDGCPESDFDGDGFDDAADACPEEPGPKTGAAGDDGCPA